MEYHYDLVLQGKAPQGKRKAEEALVDERIALKKGQLLEDGADAVVKAPEVPSKQARRKPPSRVHRSSGERLEKEKQWWLSRAFDDKKVPLRSAEISDAVAL